MPHRYIPMLKTKAGEIVALEQLSSGAKDRVLPLLHVGESLSPSFAKNMATAWGSRLIVVDGSFNFNHTGSANAALGLVQGLRNNGTPVMPSVSYADAAQYVQAASMVRDDHGLVVKASLPQIGSVVGWVVANGWSPSEVDLVIDAKHIGSVDVPTYSGYVQSILFQNAQALQQFRSVTLAAGSAPKDHGGLNYGPNHVPRDDWALWSSVRPLSPVRLDYGDYCTGHPDLTEPPGPAMASATVSARYTIDNHWLIIKGRSTGGQYGQPMAVQYMSHAQAIQAHSGFGGVQSCWADTRIQAAASGAPKMASRQKWSEIAANRHISLVADRLP